jgi:hypothetical protein
VPVKVQIKNQIKNLKKLLERMGLTAENIKSEWSHVFQRINDRLDEVVVRLELFHNDLKKAQGIRVRNLSQLSPHLLVCVLRHTPANIKIQNVSLAFMV